MRIPQIYTVFSKVTVAATSSSGACCALFDCVIKQCLESCNAAGGCYAGRQIPFRRYPHGRSVMATGVGGMVMQLCTRQQHRLWHLVTQHACWTQLQDLLVSCMMFVSFLDDNHTLQCWLKADLQPFNDCLPHGGASISDVTQLQTCCLLQQRSSIVVEMQELSCLLAEWWSPYASASDLHFLLCCLSAVFRSLLKSFLMLVL